MIAMGQNLKYSSMDSLIVTEQEGLCFCFRKFSTAACQSWKDVY